MAVKFTRAIEVQPDDPILSTQLTKLVLAWNDRLRSGLCEPWRLFYYFLSLFRAVRNQSADGAVPSEAEFHELFQHILPENSNWPTAEPGDFEGANLASMMPAFNFGAAALDLNSESDRIFDAGFSTNLHDGRNPTTPDLIWKLHKEQCGAYDSQAELIASPAFTAAQSWFRILPSMTSVHGNSYGGFRPIPQILGDCGDGTTDLAPTINYEIFFTILNPAAPIPAGTTVTDGKLIYPGTCPDVPGDVLTVWELGRYYYVFRSGGTIDILATKDFFQGPYTGGASLRKAPGQHLQRVLNAFIREFRGSDSQRLTKGYYLENSFDFDRFITTQYHLAPAKGRLKGDAINPTYLKYRWRLTDTIIPLGTLGKKETDSSTTHKFSEESILASFYVEATNLRSTTFLQVLDAGKVKKTVAVTPDKDGKFTAIVTLETAFRPSSLSFKLSTLAQFKDSSGTLFAECFEQLAYKPEEYDLYLCLRLAATTWNPDRAVDGEGPRTPFSKEISDSYFDNATILNIEGHDGLPGPLDDQVSALNTSAVYEAARRLSKCTRMVSRRNLLGYAVENGKSVLWFSRYSYGLHRDNPADIFDGIGPERLEIESLALKQGRRYIVREGSIMYDRKTFNAGQIFTATAENRFEGSGKLFEYDGIRHAAPPDDETNEWLMGAEFFAYHTSSTSIWKSDDYADIFPLSNRCHFYGLHLPNWPDLNWHYNYGLKLAIAPEAPSSHNYVHNLNGPPEADINFYKSCRIYEPWIEIESAVVSIENGEEVVKLTFKSQFHHDEGAPTNLSRDISTWDLSQLQDEVYRTKDNGIRQYLVHAFMNLNMPRKIGDSAADSEVWGNPDNPFATIYPRFSFAKLLAAPVDDGNDTYEVTDTKCLHDVIAMAELYTRVFCEGCIDTKTSVAIACADGVESFIDYTYENLNFDAFKGRSIGTVNSSRRDDLPQGFGPIPTNPIDHEQFNRLVLEVNLLTKFRVILPFKVECKVYNYSSDSEIRIMDPDGNDAGDCSTSSTVKGWWKGSGGAAGTLISTVDWSDCSDDGPQAGTGIAIPNDACALSGNWILRSTRTESDFRVALTDPDAIYAVPEIWRDMVTTNLGLLAVKFISRAKSSMKVVSDINDSSSCCFDFQAPCPGFWQRSDGKYLKFIHDDDNTSECVVLSSGRITAPGIGSQVLEAGRSPSGANCFAGPGNTAAYIPIRTNGTFLEVPLKD